MIELIVEFSQFLVVIKDDFKFFGICRLFFMIKFRLLNVDFGSLGGDFEALDDFLFSIDPSFLAVPF